MPNNIFVLLHSTNGIIHTPEVAPRYNTLWVLMRGQLLSTQQLVKPVSSGFDSWSAWLHSKNTRFKWEIVQIDGEDMPQPKKDNLWMLTRMISKTFVRPRFYATWVEAHKYMEQEMQEVLGLGDAAEPEDECESGIDNMSAYIDDFRHMDYKWEIYEIPVSKLSTK